MMMHKLLLHLSEYLNLFLIEYNNDRTNLYNTYSLYNVLRWFPLVLNTILLEILISFRL